MSTSNGKTKIVREVAEADFTRMCDAYRVDHDTSELGEEELAEWNALKDGIVRDIMRGTVIVDDGGNPTYTPTGGSKGFTFHPPTGATLMALETYAGAKNIANMIAALADMTHSDRGEFGKMPSRDVQAAGRLAKLFLADR